MPATIVTHLGGVLGNGGEYLLQGLGSIHPFFFGGISKVARISSRMLGVVNLHGSRIDVRLQGGVSVGQGLLGKSGSECWKAFLSKKIGDSGS